MAVFNNVGLTGAFRRCGRKGPAGCVAFSAEREGKPMKSLNWGELIRPVASAGVAEAVLRRLGELIGSGVLRPGDRLPSEQELARHFGVAPMTVRNALQVMRDLGILVTTRGRGAGTFVGHDIHEKLWYRGTDLPTISEFDDFTTWRTAVSGECCAIVARSATPEEVGELRSLAGSADSERGSIAVYRFADAAFHLRVAELTRSPRLLMAEQQIQDYLTRALAGGGPRSDPERLDAQLHTGIIEAIEMGWSEAARQRLAEHARATFDVMVGVGGVRQDGPPGEHE